MKTLRRTQFGNPVLREVTKRLSVEEILSDEIQTLISDMRHTLQVKQYGVGLAAPQVGRSVALSIIGIKSTPTRPSRTDLDMVVINPEIVEELGVCEPMWEGCLSFGDTKNFPYAQVPRSTKVRVRWHDEHAGLHEKTFSGLAAHVLQHEIDHLNGVLFVDRVEDPKSYMTIQEYKRRYLDKQE